MAGNCHVRYGFAFLALIALFATSAPAQQVPKVGFVDFQGPSLAGDIKHFRDGMTALGHAEGKTYELEAYFTAGDRARTQAIIDELVKKPVDVLVVRVTPVAHIAKEATKTIPVVMLVSDALATGLVQSLARPGGNLTGVTMAGPDAAGKRLEILREIRPSIHTVAFIGSSKDSNGPTFARETKTATDRLGMKLLVKFLGDPSELNEALFEGLKGDGAEAVIVQPIFTGHAARIAPLAAKSRLPIIADYPPFAEAGALMSFGVDSGERMRRLSYFVDRILKGAKPSDLPVEQPTSFKLVINVKTATALGWTVPEAFLARADEVIE
jgi:putative tryptophan/tyrosine transport system substrate-binding protein